MIVHTDTLARPVRWNTLTGLMIVHTDTLAGPVRWNTLSELMIVYTDTLAGQVRWNCNVRQLLKNACSPCQCSCPTRDIMLRAVKPSYEIFRLTSSPFTWVEFCVPCIYSLDR